jgi:two-component system chemotaxis response regulator CheB
VGSFPLFLPGTETVLSECTASRHDLIVVGASAGGVEALRVLAETLPPDLAAAVCVVLHVPSDGVSTLPRILMRAGRLPAIHVDDRTALRPGHIYVAPPNRHLSVEPGWVTPVMGPRENRHRPAVDPLFRTAAAAYGNRLIAVVLTGSGDDGSAGLTAVRREGGVVVVQDPADAFCAGMPERALEAVAADFVLPLNEIGGLLTRLAGVEAAGEPGVDEMSAQEDARRLGAEDEVKSMATGPDATPLSGFTCPDCGGRIWELDDSDVLRFRCRVGHAYSAETFLQAHSDALEGALWAALNALEENAALSRRMARRFTERQQSPTGRRLTSKAADTERQAAMLREVLERQQARTASAVAAPGGNGGNGGNGHGDLTEEDAPLHVNAIGEP